MPILDSIQLPESEGGGSAFGTPPRLFHYTDQAGLLGILQEGALRCSDAHFLNDAREVRHAVDRLAQRVEVFRADFERRDPQINDDEALLDDLLARARWLLKYPLCVFSLSVDPDLLSQWRAYCPDEGGYAIGFSTRRLKELAETQAFKLVRCIYDEERQDMELDELIREPVEAYQQEREDGAAVSSELFRRHATSFLTRFYQHAAAFKDQAFREEREWRLVADPRAVQSQAMQFRAGASTPVPYIRFLLCEESGQPLPISRVWVGPSPNPDLDLRVIKQLVDVYGLPGADVQASEIPYRNW